MSPLSERQRICSAVVKDVEAIFYGVGRAGAEFEAGGLLEVFLVASMVEVRGEQMGKFAREMFVLRGEVVWDGLRLGVVLRI